MPSRNRARVICRDFRRPSSVRRVIPSWLSRSSRSRYSVETCATRLMRTASTSASLASTSRRAASVRAASLPHRSISHAGASDDSGTALADRVPVRIHARRALARCRSAQVDRGKQCRTLEPVLRARELDPFDGDQKVAAAREGLVDQCVQLGHREHLRPGLIGKARGLCCRGRAGAMRPLLRHGDFGGDKGRRLTSREQHGREQQQPSHRAAPGASARMPKNTAYSSGTTTSVSAVAKIRPNMIVTAMLRKNGSASKRRHAQHGGRGTEEYRPRAARRGVDDRLVPRLAGANLGVDLVHQHDRVLDQHAGQAEEAQDRHELERRLEQQQTDRDTRPRPAAP